MATTCTQDAACPVARLGGHLIQANHFGGGRTDPSRGPSKTNDIHGQRVAATVGDEEPGHCATLNGQIARVHCLEELLTRPASGQQRERAGAPRTTRGNLRFPGDLTHSAASTVPVKGGTVMSSDAAVSQAAAEREFADYRGLLHAVAYRVLGSVTEAEDVVQDAWLRWSRVDVATVADPEGYLVRVATRLAIDRLRSARVRRETYVGPWLPEPIRTSPDVADKVVLADSVSTAMLLVLEALSPMERAVFVLNEAFGYSHAEIAEFVGRGEATVRQIAHRARKAVEARRRRYDTDQATRQQVTERFLAACLGGDLKALMEVLAPDVTLVSDGGGFTGAPRKPIHGHQYVARAILILSKRRPDDSHAQMLHVNGGPGIVLYSGRTPVLAITLHLVDRAIETVHVVSNPEKLTGVAP